MTLSVLSKLGLIVGVVAGLASSLYFANAVIYLMRTLEHEDYNWNEGYVRKAALSVGAGLLTTILSALLIWGIMKRRCVLVATWLAVAFPIAGDLIVQHIDRVIRYQRLDEYMIIVLLAGAQTIVTYTLIQLFLEVRRERAAVMKYFEPTKHTGKPAECV